MSAERNDVLEKLREALAGLRFGTVTVVAHDGAVVQIERTEKLRLTGAPAGGVLIDCAPCAPAS